MFKKAINSNFSQFFCFLFLVACPFGTNILAMEPEVTSLSQMSREKLEELILKQQSILNGMSENEKIVAQILGTPLSAKVVSLIDFLVLCEEEKLDVSESFQIVTDPSLPIRNEALKQFIKDETLRTLTIRDVLENKAIPEDIARRVFRGVLSWVSEGAQNEGTLIHFSPFLDKLKNMNDCIILELTCVHLNKILYSQDSVTDILIKKFLQTRKTIAVITSVPRKRIEFCLF
jgi:hypothetical protein